MTVTSTYPSMVIPIGALHAETITLPDISNIIMMKLELKVDLICLGNMGDLRDTDEYIFFKYFKTTLL